MMADDIVEQACKKTSVSPIDDMQAFIDKIATHQAAAVLIARDYNCSLQLGAHMAWLSEPYGEREFPIDPDEETFAGLASQPTTSEMSESSDVGGEGNNKVSIHDYEVDHQVSAGRFVRPLLYDSYPSKNTRSKTLMI